MDTTQIIISDQEFNGLLENNAAYLRQYFKNGKTVGFMPTLVLFDREQYDQKFSLNIVRLASDDAFESHKYQIMRLAGIKYGSNQPDHEYTAAAFFVYRSAAARFQKKDKQEIIICSGATIDGRTNAGIFIVCRGKNNWIFDLKPAKNFDTDAEEVSSDLLQAFWQGYATGKLKAWM